ncbi:MAG TPA: DUF2750 domain-containing protein [Chthonomonadaceae bacterium]|nr:DUF2750 domain-containing protein [Chthonomonadaceae bacterium]
MSCLLTYALHDAMARCPAADRYVQFVKRIAESAEVGGLRNDEGWALAADPAGCECVPIWPHPRFAKDCAVGEWQDAEPARVVVETWTERWLPGISSDGRQIAVFPLPSCAVDHGVVVSAESLGEDLRAELDRIE